MDAFRNYKKYDNTSVGNIDDYWVDHRNDGFNSKISPKGIIRAFGDYLKYGKLKKDVLR